MTGLAAEETEAVRWPVPVRLLIMVSTWGRRSGWEVRFGQISDKNPFKT